MDKILDEKVTKLKEEAKFYLMESSKYSSKYHNTMELISSITKEENAKYLYKYFKVVESFSSTYEKYIYVKGITSDYEGGWVLNGNGFTTYPFVNGQIHFDNFGESSCEGIFLNNIDIHSNLIEISKEEFYNKRNELLDKIKQETYE